MLDITSTKWYTLVVIKNVTIRVRYGTGNKIDTRMACRGGRGRHRRGGGAFLVGGVHLCGGAVRQIFFGFRGKIRLSRYVFGRVLPVPFIGRVLGVLVAVYLHQPIRSTRGQALRNAPAARAGEKLFCSDHQRRPQVSGRGVRERAAVLYAGRLRAVPMLRSLPQKDVRQRKTGARDAGAAERYEDPFRTHSPLPRLRKADVHEPSRGQHLRRGRGLACRLRALRGVHCRKRGQEGAVFGARRGHEYARHHQIPVLADDLPQQKRALCVRQP